MGRTTQILTVAGTLGCAAAIGFAMQNTDRAKRLYGEASAGTLTVPEVSAERIEASRKLMKSDALLKVEGITLTSGELDLALNMPETDADIITAAAPEPMPEPSVPLATPLQDCQITADARPTAAAMVHLTMAAPCFANERVTVHHNGMIFTEVTDADGELDLSVPALVREAVFVIAFSNAEGAVAQTIVEDLEDFDRIVLQWKGSTGFQIHAREFGADYGDAGHIWRDTPGTIPAAITGQSGFTMRYGNAETPDALMAEIYTFPKVANAQFGLVELTVETEVADLNCGNEIEAQAIQIEAGAAMETRNLTLSVPECDAKGSFLVLNNLFQDLKVAAN